MSRIPLNVINWLECIWLADLPHQSKLLAAYLRSFMNAKSDIAWPSLARISKETGLSRSSCCRYLEILEKEGWLVREKGHGGIVNKSTTYISNLPENWEELAKSRGGSVPQTLRGSPSDTTVVSHRDTNIQMNTQVNTVTTTTSGTKMIKNWFPRDETQHSLRVVHGFDQDLIDQQVPCFVAYWLDRNEVRTSFDSLFIDHCLKRRQATGISL